MDDHDAVGSRNFTAIPLNVRIQSGAFRNFSGGKHGIEPLGIEVVKDDLVTNVGKGFYYSIRDGMIEAPSGRMCEND
jgi:hypothetical protein